MKIEKINDNKVKITLTFDELEKREISLKDLEKNSAIAKDLFLDLLEESNLDDDFIIDDSQLFIEATSDNNNLFSVTITKLENIPDLHKYSLLENNTKLRSRKNYTTGNKYAVDSNIYSFNSMDDLLNLCEKSRSEDLFFGRNSLYKLEKTYFLLFSKSSTKNPKFLKTFVFLSEYCDNYYALDLFESSIKERANLIIKNTALQKLSKI